MRRFGRGAAVALATLALGGAAVFAVAVAGDEGAGGRSAVGSVRVPDGPVEVRERYGMPRFVASWGPRPDDVRGLARGVQTVVLGRVAEVREGPRFGTGESEFHQGVQDGLPSQRIVFDVEESWSKGAPARLTLFKAGDAQAWMEGDPPYEVGQRYVLFVSKADRFEAGLYKNPAPDGRLGVNGEEVVAMVEGRVSDKVDGMSVGELERAVKTEKERG